MDFTTPIKLIMTKDLTTVGPNDKVVDFVEKFKRRGIHHIPVVAKGTDLLGIISTEDINDKMSMLISPDRLLAEHIMTVLPTTINEDECLINAINVFLENSFRALPVVNKSGKLSGIITIYDLAKELVKDYDVECALEDMEDIV